MGVVDRYSKDATFFNPCPESRLGDGQCCAEVRFGQQLPALNHCPPSNHGLFAQLVSNCGGALLGIAVRKYLVEVLFYRSQDDYSLLPGFVFVDIEGRDRI